MRLCNTSNSFRKLLFAIGGNKLLVGPGLKVVGELDSGVVSADLRAVFKNYNTFLSDNVEVIGLGRICVGSPALLRIRGHWYDPFSWLGHLYHKLRVLYRHHPCRNVDFRHFESQRRGMATAYHQGSRSNHGVG